MKTKGKGKRLSEATMAVGDEVSSLALISILHSDQPFQTEVNWDADPIRLQILIQLMNIQEILREGNNLRRAGKAMNDVPKAKPFVPPVWVSSLKK